MGTPATLGAALRYAAAADPGHSGPSLTGESLTGAVGLLETTSARYELALALTDLAALLCRSGRRADARVPLRRALDLAQRTGAAPLADRARRELLAAGARPRRSALTGPDALTSAERRVAGLAADGLSNRQIAQPSPPSKRIFGTPSTSSASPPGPTCQLNWIVNFLQ